MNILSGTIFLIPFDFFGHAKDGKKTGKTKPRNISAKEAKAMMDEGGTCTIVDVRTRAEFRERHIKDAKLVPLDEIEFRAETELPDKNAVLLVYCQSGGRSASAVQILADLGYTSVYNFGGIITWPYDTVKN